MQYDEWERKPLKVSVLEKKDELILGSISYELQLAYGMVLVSVRFDSGHLLPIISLHSPNSLRSSSCAWREMFWEKCHCIPIKKVSCLWS